jgi:hypothetical protein
MLDDVVESYKDQNLYYCCNDRKDCNNFYNPSPQADCVITQLYPQAVEIRNAEINGGL